MIALADFLDVQVDGRTFRLRELTFGDLLAIIESGTENVFDATGNVRQVTNVRKMSLAILKHCVDGTVESGVFRKLSEQEILSLPARVAVRLIDECRKLNPFLALSTSTG